MSIVMERQEVKLWCGLELGFHRSLERSVWNQIFFAYDLLLLLSPILIGVLSPSVIGNHSFVKTSATLALGDCDPKSVGADRLELIATIIANKIVFKRVIFTTFSILAGKKHTQYTFIPCPRQETWTHRQVSMLNRFVFIFGFLNIAYAIFLFKKR